MVRTRDMDDVYVGGETGHQVAAQGPECPLMVLGSPVAFIGGPALIHAEMSIQKAFHANKKMFLAKTGIRARPRHTIWCCARLACGAHPPGQSNAILRTANGIQLHRTRDMLKIARTPGETWVDWNTRSLRQARIALVKYKIPRWSTRILEAMWNLWDMSDGQRTPPHVTSLHGEEWPGGNRRRPNQTKLELGTQASSTLDYGTPHQQYSGHHLLWWKVAANRELRASKQQQFVDRHDVPCLAASKALFPTSRISPPTNPNASGRPVEA